MVHSAVVVPVGQAAVVGHHGHKHVVHHGVSINSPLANIKSLNHEPRG